MTAALQVYEDSLVGDGAPLLLRYEDGRERVLPIAVWTCEVAPGDVSILDRCVGPTLDVGCGPGRLTLALGRRGLPALGIDISSGATHLARSRGALVLARSVFATLPGHGRWSTALLADGNVGIGGDPVGLLSRVRQLLTASGRVVVELGPPGSGSGVEWVRIEHGGRTSERFRWAQVAVDHVRVVAEAACLQVTEEWCDSGRWFVVLEQSRGERR